MAEIWTALSLTRTALWSSFLSSVAKMETTLVLDNSCSIFSNISLVRIEVKIQVYLEAFSGTPAIIIISFTA